MRDDYCTSRKVLETFLKSTDCVYVNIVGRLVEKEHVALILESKGKVKTVSLTT